MTEDQRSPEGQAFQAEVEAALPPRPPQPPPKPSTLKGKGKPSLRYSDVPTALHKLVERAKRGDAGSLLTGWPSVDRDLDQPVLSGEVMMLAARTGVGKTWAVNTILERALRREAAMHVLLASLEMTDLQIAHRLAAHALNTTPRTIWEDMQNDMTRPEDVMRAAPELERMLILDSGLPVTRLGEAIEQATTLLGEKPGIVAVDYFGLLGWEGRGSASQYERTSENARLLKEVVKEQDVVCLLAVQLSRLGGGSGDKEPTIESLRDSGVAEETADRILAFWRAAEPEEDEPLRLTGSEIKARLIKNRFGPLGKPRDLRYSESLILEEFEPESPYAIKATEVPKDAWWGKD